MAAAVVAHQAVGARMIAATAVGGVDMRVDTGLTTLEGRLRASALTGVAHLAGATGAEAAAAVPWVSGCIHALSAALHQPLGARRARCVGPVAPWRWPSALRLVLSDSSN